MRILLVHNYYGSSAPSGENQVFEIECALLRTYGHEVETFTRHSDEIRSQGRWGELKGALSTTWNPWTALEITQKIKSFVPEVVHVHNTFPMISPSIFDAIGKRAAKVLTLHNYRLFCPAAIPMRGGQVCTDCLDIHSAWPAVKFGCYRDSRVSTLPLAFSVGLHRTIGTWTKNVDAFIVLSEFQRKRMVDAGLPQSKVHVKPNFYGGIPQEAVWSDRGNYLVFSGRLTAEKGLISLLMAWAEWGADAPELRVVGDGPLRPKLEQLSKGLPVRFLGQLSLAEAQSQIARARLLVLPSECFEGFPMVIREAFAFGTPVAVSEIGPLPVIVKCGLSGIVFEPSNPKSLLQEVRQAWQKPGFLERLGQGARLEFETKYTEGVNYDTLMEIYESALVVSGRLD